MERSLLINIYWQLICCYLFAWAVFSHGVKAVQWRFESFVWRRSLLNTWHYHFWIIGWNRGTSTTLLLMFCTNKFSCSFVWLLIRITVLLLEYFSLVASNMCVFLFVCCISGMTTAVLFGLLLMQVCLFPYLLTVDWIRASIQIYTLIYPEMFLDEEYLTAVLMLMLKWCYSDKS